jgi:hypothetical protein
LSDTKNEIETIDTTARKSTADGNIKQLTEKQLKRQEEIKTIRQKLKSAKEKNWNY